MCEQSSFFTYPPVEPDGVPHKAYILLHAASSQWMVVNRTTIEIARRLDRGESPRQVAQWLIAGFGIPAERAASDVSYVSEQLMQAGFLSGKARKFPFPERIPAIKSIYFHLTGRCNLSCPHCYVSEKSGDIPSSLIFRIIEELIDHGGKSVVFSGGEPLLHPEIKDILKYTASKLQVRLLTNGTLIDRDLAAFLAELNCWVQISIDGSSEEIHDSIRGKGSYDKAVKALEHLQEAGLSDKIHFCTTIMKQNLHDLPQIVHLAEERKVPFVRFLRLRKEGSATRNWESIGAEITYEDHGAFYRSISGIQRNHARSTEVGCGLSGFMLKVPENHSDDDMWCDVGRQMAISLDGDVFPCVFLMREPFRLGNIFRQSLGEMVSAEGMQLVCRTIAQRRTKIAKCASCPWRNLCQAGCMGHALDHTGTIWDTDGFCNHRKQEYEAAFNQILEDFS